VKNLPAEMETLLQESILATMLFDPKVVVIPDDISVSDLRNLVRAILQHVDEALENVCIPHDFVRMAGTAGKAACARCGVEADLHPDNRRVILSDVVPRPKIAKRMTPEEQVLSDVKNSEEEE
jgi:hypothetical protein